MESNRCSQTMEESSDVVEVIVIPDDPPSSQDITVLSVSSTSSSCSSSSALRVTENSQLLAAHFVTTTDPADCYMTSGVNRPPQLPMGNRRESQTGGESTVNTSTAIFRPLNVPALPSSQASSTLTQSTYPMPRGSAASLPANEPCYSNFPSPRPLPLCAVQTASSSDSMSLGERKRRMSPGCSNQDPKQPRTTSVDLPVKQGTPTDDELEKLGKEIAEKWMKLGRRLKVEESELQDIEQRYRQLCERGYHMLIYWKRKNGSAATYQILNAALQHELVQRKDLAHQICYNQGVFAVEESHLSLTICPRHRAEFGMRWRSSKVKCSIPLEIAAHKTASVKGDRHLESVLSAFILNTEGILIQVGSPLCRMCKQHFTETNQQQKVTPAPMIEVTPCVELETSEANNSSNSSPGQSDTGQSVEEFAESLGRLTIADDTFLSPDTISTASTQSDEPTPVILHEPREKLSEFLAACKLEPLGKPWLSWSNSSDRTRQRQTRRATEIVATVLKSVTPDNAGELWRRLASSTAMNKALGVSELSHSEHLYLEALAEAYQNATSWDTRRQVLSIMAGVGTFNDISRYIPGLTRYRYSMANLHRSQFGRGAQVPQQPTTRIRVDLRQLDHFLGFITSPHLVQDLPFGQKHLKLSSGEVIQVPNVIRMMIPERVIQQYTQYCLEINFKPFSETTMRRVLFECSASVRKSLQGLDYFAAEGARAFDDLVALVRQIGGLGSGKEWETTVVQALMTSKQYLKGDYKVHVTSPSNVADHCVLFALSDSSDADYQQQCSHQHTDLCDRCQSLQETLAKIERVLGETTFPTQDAKDEALFIFQTAQLAIMSWKCHILRSANQDQARIDALEKLDDNTVLIINDWAMKFLPQKYRESQADWFGKRGISWHVSVVYRRVSGVLQWQGFLHIVQSCNQGSAAVVKIMQDVLNTIKLEHSEINKAFFRQDNAGCYHSSSTVLSCPVISSSTGIEIKRIDFSDPQGGKGAADRLAATCKNHVRTFINEGNDVTNAEQLKSALLSHGGIEGVRVAVMQSVEEEAVVDDNRKITGINKLNNFEFKDEILVAWRAYGMGKGKEIPLETTSEEHGIGWLSSEFSSGDFKPLSPKPTQSRKKQETEVEQVHDPTENTNESSSVFTCPQDGCVKVFQRLSSLEKHLSLEKCTKSLEKRSLLDLAKLDYKSRLEEGTTSQVISFASFRDTREATSGEVEVKEGWALKPSKKAYHFNQNQRDYLNAKFTIGQTSGRKLDGDIVSREMRRAQGPDGVRLFKVSEFLTPQQCTSYFSRLAAKVRRQTSDDAEIQAVVEEENFAMARETILSITLQHPITYDQYDICAMAKGGSLERLKLGMLQNICQQLELEVPPKPVRRKALYVDLLKKAVINCTCQLRGKNM